MSDESSNTNSDMIKLPEAAEYLGLPKDRLRAMVRAGSIPFYRLSPRDTRFRITDLDAWLNSCRQG